MNLSQLFIVNMFSKNSIPSYILCDYESEFIFYFFYLLGEALDMCIYFTSGYYSEADSHTEWVNQTLK